MAIRRVKRSKSEYFQSAAREWMRLQGVTEFDPDEVAKWMVETRQYEETPYSAVRRCKQELTKALRSQRMNDPSGRDVRAMLCARHKNGDGSLFSKWSPIYEATPQHARLSLQQWRRSIRGEVLLHDRTAISYKEFGVHGAELSLFDYDFNKDRDEANQPKDWPEERPDSDQPPSGDQPPA